MFRPSLLVLAHPKQDVVTTELLSAAADTHQKIHQQQIVKTLKDSKNCYNELKTQ